MNRDNFHWEIFTVARDIYERSGRIEGRDLDNWLEAEKIVTALRKIAGENDQRHIFINVPPPAKLDEDAKWMGQFLKE
ncbi:MAG TPA: DUF2934 domain-containing protein [Thermodesulfovibrionales bacterium]|nr:DUF2934 domain-containing protein [Thermodesulfovibrionales bacterium]